MEVHAPHQPILTLREALVHLSIVTVGILIALSLDGVREWREHRSLAAEARANLLAEIRGNKEDLDRVLATFDKAKADYRVAYAAAQNLLASQPLGTNEIHIGAEMAQLTAGAYATAEVTGAFAYMEYDDVRRFATVYDLQRKYDALQDQSVSYVAAASGPLLLLSDPTEARGRQLEDWTVNIEQALAALNVRQQLAQQLSKTYGELLAGESH